MIHYFLKIISKLALRYARFIRPIFDQLPTSIREFIKKHFYSSLNLKLSTQNNENYRKITFDELGNPKISIELKQKKPIINLVGFATGQLGLGEMFRATERSFKSAKIPYEIVDFGKILGHKQDTNKTTLNVPTNNRCNIFIMPTDQLKMIFMDQPKLFENSYNIHYGAWELTTYPMEWRSCFNIIDEFWCMSKFMHQTLLPICPIPCLHFPLSIDNLSCISNKAKFGWSQDDFIVLSMLDLSSSFQRKNPIGSIRAFKQAFINNENVKLIIKINRVGRQEELQILELFKNEIGQDNRIKILDLVLSRNDLIELMASCDVFMSLHKAEGFGLSIAEAMSLGIPTIYTKYSGNMDFCQSDDPLGIPFKLIQPSLGDYPFAEQNQLWAEPNLEIASSVLKHQFHNRDFTIKQQNEYVLETISPNKIGLNMQERLNLVLN